MYIKNIALFGFSFLILNVIAIDLQILEPKVDNRHIKKVNNISKQTHINPDLIIELTKSAKKGNARAQFSLGNIYYNGIDIEQDYMLAFYWYMQVAKAGYASAQLNIAKMYEQGLGTTKDIKKAQHWYQQTAKSGNDYAQYRLSELLKNQNTTLVKPTTNTYALYKNKITSTSQHKSNKIADIDNIAITKQKNDHIIQTLIKSAKQNNTFAQYSLAMFYYTGELAPQDKVKAFYWWQKSAKLGFLESKISLALMYYHGEGVAKNYNLALKWAKDATKSDNKRANASYKYLLNNPF